MAEVGVQEAETAYRRLGKVTLRLWRVSMRQSHDTKAESSSNIKLNSEIIYNAGPSPI